jgi:hypothetical protein
MQTAPREPLAIEGASVSDPELFGAKLVTAGGLDWRPTSTDCADRWSIWTQSVHPQAHEKAVEIEARQDCPARCIRRTWLGIARMRRITRPAFVTMI